MSQPSHGRARTRLHWCPTGVFSAFPLHAAGIYTGSQKACSAGYVVSSYTPTVTALLRAQKTQRSLSREDLSVALIAEKQAQDSAFPVILGVEEEIEHVAAIAQSKGVEIVHHQANDTTMADTAFVMEAANVLHLACHGIQDTYEATKSGFCLGDGRLTIERLMELKLDHVFLAFLSACETAKGDKEQPDQVMHLAAAMLFSGFRSVIATMWYVLHVMYLVCCMLMASRAIADADGPNVAKWFYEELFAREEVNSDSVAYALDFAVGRLRDSGVSPHRWAPFIHMGA
jgi:CHAT domain-containing protein